MSNLTGQEIIVKQEKEYKILEKAAYLILKDWYHDVHRFDGYDCYSNILQEYIDRVENKLVNN